MGNKFIKYKENQINLAQMYRFSSGAELDSKDVFNGTLVIGFYSDGKYLSMGYLRGITQDQNTGKVTYQIENAIEGQEYSTSIEKPYKVDNSRLPYVAAYPNNSNKPIVGKVIECNGELATIYDGSNTVVNVNSIHTLEPYFKETK